MAKNKKHENSLLYSPFTLNNGPEIIQFNDVDDFVQKTGISGAVASDLLTGASTNFRTWTKTPQELRY